MVHLADLSDRGAAGQRISSRSSSVRTPAGGSVRISATSAFRRHRGPDLVEEVGDRLGLAHPAQPGVAGRVAAARLGLALQQADHPGPDPVAGRAIGEVLGAHVVDQPAEHFGADPPPVRGVRHRHRFDGPADVRVEGGGEHGGHPGVVLDRRGGRGLPGADRHGGDQVVDRGLRDLDLAQGRQHRRDVGQERPVRADHQHAGPAQPLAVQVEQVGGAVQADGGLAGAGRALHADRDVQVGPDQLVLLRLDGGDDVAHGPDAGPLDLGGQDPARGAELLTAVEVLVFEAGQQPGGEPEPAADRDALRLARAGPVERPGHRRPPVEHHRLAVVVGDVPAPDVVAVPGVVLRPPARSRSRAARRTAACPGRRPTRRRGGRAYARASQRRRSHRRRCRRC